MVTSSKSLQVADEPFFQDHVLSGRVWVNQLCTYIITMWVNTICILAMEVKYVLSSMYNLRYYTFQKKS